MTKLKDAFDNICVYRCGVVYRGKVMVECRFAGEAYEIEEAIVVCREFCPFKKSENKY